MSKLIFTGDSSACSYESTQFTEGIFWLQELSVIGLDTETNVVESHLNRQLKVISIADEAGDKIWVLEWEFLTPMEKKMLLNQLSKKLCIIQNVSFDYKMFAKYGTKLEKVWDTMLGEQVLSNGLSKEKGYHGLAGIMFRRFGLVISKDEQLTFGDGGPYTDDQIKYAAIDVLKLGALRLIQLKEMRAFDKRVKQRGNKGLVKTMWWENEFVKCVADMEITGVRIDKDKWYAIEDSVRPTYDKELKALNELVIKDFWDILEHNNWISSTDDFVEPVWSSSQKKKLILGVIYDFEIDKTSKTELKKYLQAHDPDFPEGLKLSGKAWTTDDYPVTFNTKFAVLKLMILSGKDQDMTDHLNAFLLTNMKQFCVDAGWLRPAGQLSLNWSSPAQRLTIFQAINPAIQSTGKDVIVDYIEDHSIILHYLAWGETEYQLKNFGKPFYDKHVEVDGKHRTRFNQILATGRLSSVSPNMLNIPRKIEAYRAAVIPDEGFELIDADYDGQELVITTEISQEPSWMSYLKLGYDLHSKNAELIFGDAWITATEQDCAYYAEVPRVDRNTYAFQKCKCKGHEDMRDKSKAVSFGSIYGISFIKLAFNLKISEDEAKYILKRFFEIVPGVADMMVRFGNYALQHGHIIEPVFGRVRFFDEWKLAVPAEHGSIERASFNTPIQSSGSACLKIAFVLMRRWLNHNNHNDNIQLLLPYHDETIAQSRPAFTTLAKEQVSHFMRLGAKLAGFDIQAGSKSGKSWLEAH